MVLQYWRSSSFSPTPRTSRLSTCPLGGRSIVRPKTMGRSASGTRHTASRQSAMKASTSTCRSSGLAKQQVFSPRAAGSLRPVVWAGPGMSPNPSIDGRTPAASLRSRCGSRAYGRSERRAKRRKAGPFRLQPLQRRERPLRSVLVLMTSARSVSGIGSGSAREATGSPWVMSRTLRLTRSQPRGCYRCRSPRNGPGGAAIDVFCEVGKLLHI